MNKNLDSWVLLHPNLKKLIMETKIAFIIIAVFVSNVLAVPAYPGVIDLISEAESQQISVSGTIKDASTSEAMPGVNIQVKGTTFGTITFSNRQECNPGILIYRLCYTGNSIEWQSFTRCFPCK
jgi:hypothetical protein